MRGVELTMTLVLGSFLLGCSLRAGVNLLVVALRVTKKR